MRSKIIQQKTYNDKIDFLVEHLMKIGGRICPLTENNTCESRDVNPYFCACHDKEKIKKCWNTSIDKDVDDFYEKNKEEKHLYLYTEIKSRLIIKRLIKINPVFCPLDTHHKCGFEGQNNCCACLDIEKKENCWDKAITLQILEQMKPQYVDNQKRKF